MLNAMYCVLIDVNKTTPNSDNYICCIFLQMPQQFDVNSTLIADLILSLSEVTHRVSALMNINVQILEQTIPYFANPQVWQGVIQKFTNSLQYVQFDPMRLVV